MGNLPYHYPYLDLALLECLPSAFPLFSPYFLFLPMSLWVQLYRSLKQTLSQYFIQNFYLKCSTLSTLHWLVFSPFCSLNSQQCLSCFSARSKPQGSCQHAESKSGDQPTDAVSESLGKGPRHPYCWPAPGGCLHQVQLADTVLRSDVVSVLCQRQKENTFLSHVGGTKDGLDSPILTDIERKALWHHVPKTYKCS